MKDQTFAFDRVFDENTTQGDVYEATTRNLLDSVLDGYNATVFAYGATGCGKTHTITGTAQQPGIIFMTMQELFEKIAETQADKSTEISLSYLEIYNETIRDLLVPGGSKQGLMLREDANQTVSVPGLSSHHPQNVQEVMEMIMRGNEYRTMSPTEANATSSRSHAVLQINVAQKDRNANVNEPHTMATLSIIDLAGSERASATKNRGERLIEGANINKSLLALGSCINALCDPRKHNHVPYRNSKLTRLLKFSLGGNCRTVMIVCVSPSSQHFDETQNTLRYANRAKNIQTKVTRNVFNVNRHVKDFLVKIDEQMNMIKELQEQQKDSEKIAFVKFKKQYDKKEILLREGVARVRSAYEHSAPERQEKTSNMLKSRQIGRRIAMLSAWIAAFDAVCEEQGDEEEPLRSLQAVRKSAQGILVELEGSRHHYNQKMGKSSWEAKLDLAVETGVKQLKELEIADARDIANLTREAEFLKSNADREVMLAVSEQEKAGEAAMMQVLLHAHFEAVATVESVSKLSEEEAVEAGKKILSKILTASSTAASNVVKPDGNIMPVELFPPTKGGTPRRKKYSNVGVSPVKPLAMNAASAIAPHLTASPTKASPKRKKFGGAKKGISFTPKKKSPLKNKRVVRWKDDAEEGALAEYEKTPQKQMTPSTDEMSSTEPALPKLSSIPIRSPRSGDSRESSPVPEAPEMTLSSLHVPKKNGRFATGFLSKKTNGSPPPPTLTSLSSSDSENSPLREFSNNNLNKSSLSYVESINDPPLDSMQHSSGSDNDWDHPSRSDALEITTAMKRTSIGSSGLASNTASRAQRRRSPSGTHLHISGSPPSSHENHLFTAGQARRMVKSEKENDVKVSVLSPRTAPIVKSGVRRTTLTGAGGVVGVHGRSVSGGSVGGHRGSLMPSGKGSWR